SLNFSMQKAANEAVLDGLATYERRHGWKGRLQNALHASPVPGGDLEEFEHPDWDEVIEQGSYLHGLVTATSASGAEVRLGRYRATLAPADIKWTGYVSPAQLLSRGDLVYVKVLEFETLSRVRISLEQESGVQGALVALDNSTGDILAMVGGRDFRGSKFNRATQALRQVGSSFKPFVYTAAIDQGSTPDDVVVDEPTTFFTASGPYTPH